MRPQDPLGGQDVLDPSPSDAILRRYADLVANSPHNLVSRQARAELLDRHVPEARRFAETLPGPARLLDVGSGGGLPGLVIAAVRPELEVHLLEATGKKAAFLEAAAAELGLAVTVHHGRAEDLGKGPLAGSFDLVTARAVAPLERLVRLTTPFLRVGGTLHAIKGARWEEELADASGRLDPLGLRVRATPHAGPPGEGSEGDAEAPLRVVVLERVAR